MNLKTSVMKKSPLWKRKCWSKSIGKFPLLICKDGVPLCEVSLGCLLATDCVRSSFVTVHLYDWSLSETEHGGPSPSGCVCTGLSDSGGLHTEGRANGRNSALRSTRQTQLYEAAATHGLDTRVSDARGWWAPPNNRLLENNKKWCVLF